MPSYTLELELLGIYSLDMPGFEIWADGSMLGASYSIPSSGTSLSVSSSFGGALPSSLEFRFNDASSEVGRKIEVHSVKINDRYVNTGNYLSSNSLVNGGNATVDIAAAEFIFDSSADPAASEFTTGATRTFTGANETVQGYLGTTDEVFDMLGGNDYAYLGSGDDKVSGGDGNDTLRGGDGNDLLFGGADDDRLYGMDGDDRLYGGTGNDTIHGNNGDDEIHGGDGNDSLVGHADNDTITGGIGNDTVNGGSGDDNLFGDAGADYVIGGAGNDTLDGGDGDDIVYGGTGNDQMDGGDGADSMSGSSGTDILNGGDGDDLMLGGADDDILRGGADNDDIYGGTGVDDISGGTGNDNLYGDDGNDTLEGNDGDDIIRGGDGNDIIYANANTGIYNADWDYKRSITIDSTMVGSDLTNFTVLISEDGMDANFWSNVKADGSDILITLADGVTVLDREVVSIDTVAETLELHIRIPNLSSSLDTELKLHYGNASATLANDATTWNENYAGVWHLDDDLSAGSAVIEDSSRSQLDGAARGGLASGDIVTAQVGDGLNFNGTSDYIALQHSYTAATTLTSLSVTAWVNTSITGGGAFGNWAILDYDRSEFFNVYIHGDTGQLSFSTSAGGVDDFSGGADIADGAWHHIAAVYDGTDKILYVDGVEVARDINSHGGAAITDTTTRFGIIGDGSEAGGFDGGRNNIYYDGEVDDVRLYEGTLTADEIAAQFDNQDDPSAFYSVGTVETTTIIETDDNDTLEGGDGDDILYASAGDDSLNGGDGFDMLYGGSGVNTFILEAASAYNDVDEIINYRFSEGDILDISDLITGTFSGTITDYLQFADSGTNTLIQVDSDGTSGGSSFTTAGQINNITGLDESTLYADGNIIA